jgi:acetyltransferase-like isoleucine patch superfamily enzyme
MSVGDRLAIGFKRAVTLLVVVQRKGYWAQMSRQGLKHGRDLNVQRGVDISDPHLVTIGDFVTLGPYAQLVAHDASYRRIIGYTRFGRITIGNRVFVGQRATILPGVSVGDEAIIAAGAVVESDVPPRTIVAGNPAKVVKQLTNAELKKKQVQAESQLIEKGQVPPDTFGWRGERLPLTEAPLERRGLGTEDGRGQVEVDPGRLRRTGTISAKPPTR